MERITESEETISWQGARATVHLLWRVHPERRDSRGQGSRRATSRAYSAWASVFTKENLLTDMEHGGTPWSRAVINVNVAFQELGKR